MTAVSRFRAPHKVHVLSWALALERDGSVSCHFKDCQFMALSVEEMGNHYPFCTCENSKFPFICEICNRRTDHFEKLLLHKIYSHSYVPTNEESKKINDYQNLPPKKEITPILKRSWEIFLEKKKYLKCLLRQCLFVTHSMENMENHYLNLCKKDCWPLLKYECEFCFGRVMNDNDLKLHIKTAHESKTYLISNTIVPDSNLNCVELWSNDILIYKQGKCFIDGCRFVDNNVKILEKHYASCNGKKRNFVVCCACGSWLQNENRLNEHRRCLHKDLDDSTFTNSPQFNEKDSGNQASQPFDEKLLSENDSWFGIKKIKMEELVETSQEVEIPVLYLQPDDIICSPENEVMLEDPLALHPSSSTMMLEPIISTNIVDYEDMKQISSLSHSLNDSASTQKVVIQEERGVIKNHISSKSIHLIKTYRKRVNILKK